MKVMLITLQAFRQEGFSTFPSFNFFLLLLLLLLLLWGVGVHCSIYKGSYNISLTSFELENGDHWNNCLEPDTNIVEMRESTHKQIYLVIFRKKDSTIILRPLA
jgi:hypothetical protein